MFVARSMTGVEVMPRSFPTSAPGATVMNSMDLYFLPYTHSLVGAAAFSVVIGGGVAALASPALRWRAFATTALSSATVTAKLSQSVASSLTIMSFTGVNTSGANGSGAIGAIGK